MNGTTYNGFMPAWSQFSDDQVANVLTRRHKLGRHPADFVPYQAADVAAERGKDLDAEDVHSIRGQLS